MNCSQKKKSNKSLTHPKTNTTNTHLHNNEINKKHILASVRFSVFVVVSRTL